MRYAWNATRGCCESPPLGDVKDRIHLFLGSFLHFAFELSRFHKGIAVAAAVNESVWEHLKLGFWPAVFWALIEYPFLKRSNFIAAKAVSFYVIPFSFVVLFNVYTTILGHDSLVLDILIFVIAIIMGQFASYKILESQNLLNRMTGSPSLL